MKTLRMTAAVLMATAWAVSVPRECAAQTQCCLSEFFAGCGTCFKKAPVYAVAPVMAPVAAPVMAPVPAPPPPVMVPMQQTSYVPETTYRTQYQCVPVTTYKPSCEIDPCTGCPQECMQPVTQYVQQAVNVPVTQYRAVTTTKYVQMQPGYAAPTGYAAPPMPTAPAAPAASPFAAPIQTTPQAWGAAGADVPQQLIPGQPATTPPALPPAGYATPTFQQPQPIVPQSGTTLMPAMPAAPQPQPTQPPGLAPTPSLKPIPDLQRTYGSGNGTAAPQTPAAPQLPAAPYAPAAPPAFAPVPSGTAPAQPSATGTNGMPVLPGSGPGAATRAFPRLLEPTSHTTSWQPASVGPRYPTAALPTTLGTR
jgi:hypothetical protein